MKKLKNSGFTLTEVMIAAAILGGISLVMMQMMSQQSKMSIRNTQDNDLAQTNSRILNIFTNPSHCNANLVGLPLATTTTPNALYTCKGAGTNPLCTSTGFSRATDANATYPSVINSSNVSTETSILGTWDASITAATTGISSSLRIRKVTISVSPTSPPSIVGLKMIGTATINVYFDAKKPAKTESVIDYSKTNAYANTTYSKTFAAPVILENGSTTIIGCPRSFNSTVPY